LKLNSEEGEREKEAKALHPPAYLPEEDLVDKPGET